MSVNQPVSVSVYVQYILKPKKLETGLRTNSAGIPFTLLLRIEAFTLSQLGHARRGQWCVVGVRQEQGPLAAKTNFQKPARIEAFGFPAFGLLL